MHFYPLWEKKQGRKMMLYYELKKIWVKPATKIAMIILAVLLFAVCWSAVRGVYWLDDNHERVYGTEGIQTLKAATASKSEILEGIDIPKVGKEPFSCHGSIFYAPNDFTSYPPPRTPPQSPLPVRPSEIPCRRCQSHSQSTLAYLRQSPFSTLPPLPRTL